MTRVSLFLIASFALFGSACDRWEEAQPGSIKPPAARESGPVASAPDSHEFDLAKLESDYKAAKAEFDANPNAKPKFVEAAVRYADALNYGPGEPRQKYPAALAIYESVLELDPKNEDASKGRQMILDVYKSMGMEPRKLE